MFQTKELQFGKQFAEMAEIGITWLDDSSQLVIRALEESEKQLWCDVGDVPMVGYLDSAKKDLSEFLEYKTWKTPWTQERVNNHWQLYVYAIMIAVLTGKLPKAKLLWIQTEDDWIGWIRATGKVEEFDVNFDPVAIEDWKHKIIRAWEEIKKAHEAWENGDILDILDVIEYQEIQKQIDELVAKQTELKVKIKADLEKSWMPTYKSDFGMFYFTKKDTYEYPENIKNAEALIKEAKKEFEKTAKPKTTTSLAYRK